ncbi:MAG: shikimate dehydrogenase [Alphaproteobacteria bacterium]|nr:shikimate dehydrogenase [Alphaproteobacteria bacterium]
MNRTDGTALIKAGVIGHPIGHSKSPLIHGYWLKKYGIAGDYSRYDIAPENLARDVDHLIKEGIQGFNVTIPHKQTILKLCSELSPEAEKIGAVNTVIVRADGTLFGTNTDGFGFIHNIRDSVSNFDFSRKPAVILGAGGAARSIVCALIEQNCPKIIVCNRTKDKADALALEFGVSSADWDERHFLVRSAGLFINTTSLGMVGQPPLIIDLQDADPKLLVCDIVYVPLMTELLKQAQGTGLSVVTGMGMLLHQARPGFEAWFGQSPEVTDELRTLLSNAA